MQDAINNSFSYATADPTLDFGSTLGANFAGWSWPDLLDVTQASPLLQQAYSQTQAASDVINSTVDPVLFDSIAQPFEHNNAVYQPAVLDGSVAYDT